MSQNNKPRSTGLKLILLSIALVFIMCIPALEKYSVYIFLFAIAILIVGIIMAIKDAVYNRRNRNNQAYETPSAVSSTVPRPASFVQPSHPGLPFKPPKEHHGAYLSYTYDDVKVDTSAADYSLIQGIPVNTVLSFKRLDDQQLELYSGYTLIGAMYDNRLRSMANDFLRDPDRSVMAVLLSSNPVVIGLYFYNSGAYFVRKMEQNENSKIYKLVSNANSEMQENISNCDEGAIVDFSFDDDKNKYLVSTGPYDIGYMPVSFNKYAEQYADVDGRIYEIDDSDDDDDKYVVSVIVIPSE